MNVSMLMLAVLFVWFGAAETQRSGNCRVWGIDFIHGQIFTLPGVSRCLRFRCYQGLWTLYDEGCLVHGACYHLGDVTSEDNCITYTCTKSIVDHTVIYHKTVNKTRCRDNNGGCHDSGSTGFSYERNGTLFRICACIVLRKGHVLYYCN